MERRIFGLENEYGVTCTLRGQRRLSPGRGPLFFHRFHASGSETLRYHAIEASVRTAAM